MLSVWLMRCCLAGLLALAAVCAAAGARWTLRRLRAGLRPSALAALALVAAIATGHVNAISFEMPCGDFDRDGNSLLDWWEAATGLNAAANGGAYADADGDGLINLHEFWAGCPVL